MIDQLIVGLYLLITLVVGLYVGRNTNTLEDFAVGQRNFSTLVLVSTVFASVVDAGMTTGLASSTYSVGPIFLLSFMGIIFSNFSLSFFIAPKMKPFLGLLSSGDIFEKLYGKRAKTLMGFSTIVESTLTAAVQIFAITQISQFFFGFSPVLASIIVTFIIVLYTFRGGIRSVTATDVFQFGIMVIAIPIMCGIALNEIGGFSAISSLLKENPLYFPGQNKSDHLEYLALFISFSLPCLYPLCIQRMLMAKNTKQISSAFLINGLLSLPFYLSIGLIGLIAYLALPETDPNIVFPALINQVLPIGVKGLVLAGLVAIFMSTVDSILNIGSLAIIHDVVGSTVKGGLDPKTELRLMKLASFSIAVSALIICHLFTSVMSIVFFLLVVGNSIFFPGFLWGILGFKASKNGFWMGVIAASLILIIGSFILNLFPLYTMLIAITVNSGFLLIDYYLDRPFRRLSISSFLSLDHTEIIKNIRRNAFLKSSIRNQDNCTVFFVCAIAISLFPFFFPAIQGLKSFDPTILTVSIIIAVVSLLMVFRELWWNNVDKLFSIIWILSLTLALPTQSFYMLLKSNFSIVWLADCIIILPLLFLLTTRSASLVALCLGIILSLVLFEFSEPLFTPEIASSFGYWALVIHITVLAICLALFRKRDQETFVLTSSTLAHEVSRSFLAFENAACYLNKYLPPIISSYRGQEVAMGISTTALDELMTLPGQLEQAAKRSLYIVEKLSFSSISTRAHFDNFNIAISLNNAINDPSIKGYLSNKLSVNHASKLIINGDINQMTQAFINILENSLHAVVNKSAPLIQIIIKHDSVIIRDNGDGVDKADLPNIFDESFSTKSTKGQGLAFCKSIMKNHGGTISCCSVKGEFAEFRLSFPPLKNQEK